MPRNPSKFYDPAGKEGLAAALERVERRKHATLVNKPIPVNVAKLRACTGLTQEQFAARFGFSVATLRHWEQGSRKPRGASLVLLNIIAHDPKAVVKAIS
jgi:putative transcriptional regulator